MFYRILIILLFISLSTCVFANSRALKKEFVDMVKEKRIALIIGNAKYQSNPLRNPVNDANSMAETLKKLNFEVLLYTDITQKKMKRAIGEFGRKIRDNRGVGLFYYAGHGMQVNGRNYLIPVNAVVEVEDDVEYESIDLGRVLGKMNAANNRLNIVILDACRNNPFQRSFRSGNKGLAQVNAPRGTFIAYATAPGSVAADGSGSNGLFTSKLIKHMNEGISIERLFKKVRYEVQETTKDAQVPWTSSSMTGEFYFKIPEMLLNMHKEVKDLTKGNLKVAVDDSLFGDIENKVQGKAKIKQSKSEIISSMEKDFIKAQTLIAKGLDKKTQKKVWQRYIDAYSNDIPGTKKDNDLIKKAKNELHNSLTIDPQTGLFWQDNFDSKKVWKNWKGAKRYCKNLNLGSFDDWRLPDNDELLTLYKNRAILENVADEYYWSSSSADYSGGKRVVNFKNGGDVWQYTKNAGYIRCVRDKM